MDKNAYWLLNAAIIYPMPLIHLKNEELIEHWNGPPHGMGIDALVQNLYALYTTDAIRFSANNGENLTESLALSPQELQNHIQYNMQSPSLLKIRYWLTSKGGALWENLSYPKWSRYVNESYWPEQQGEIVGLDRDYISQHLHLWVTTGSRKIQEETVIWDTIQPWWATYWKQFPLGYRVSFHYTTSSVTEITEPQAVEESVKRWTEYTLSRQWYTNYYLKQG